MRNTALSNCGMEFEFFMFNFVIAEKLLTVCLFLCWIIHDVNKIFNAIIINIIIYCKSKVLILCVFHGNNESITQVLFLMN